MNDEKNKEVVYAHTANAIKSKCYIGKDENVMIALNGNHYRNDDPKHINVGKYLLIKCTCGCERFKRIDYMSAYRSITRCPKCGSKTFIWDYYNAYTSISIKSDKEDLSVDDFYAAVKEKYSNLPIENVSPIEYVFLPDAVISGKKIFQQKKISAITDLIEHKLSVTPMHSYTFSMDVANKNMPIKIMIDGKEVKATVKNIEKCLSYARIASRVVTDIFHSTAKYINSNSTSGWLDEMATSNVVLMLKNNPSLEILYDTYGSLKCISHISPHYLHNEETLPHKILGLAKGTWELYMTVCNRDNHLQIEFPDVSEAYNVGGVNIANKFLEMRYQLFESAYRNVSFQEFKFFVLDHKYDAKRLTDYLRNDLWMRHGIESPLAGLIILRDYIKMSEEMGCEYEKYPKSLKLAHDVAMRNYKITFNEEDQARFNDSINGEYYKSLEYNGKDFIICRPESIESIVQEAKKLRHCADSYIRSVIDGYTMIFFMRKKDNPETPWITIEVRNNYVAQYAGFGDMVPDKDVTEKINEWEKAKSLR